MAIATASNRNPPSLDCRRFVSMTCCCSCTWLRSGYPGARLRRFFQLWFPTIPSLQCHFLVVLGGPVRDLLQGLFAQSLLQKLFRNSEKGGFGPLGCCTILTSYSQKPPKVKRVGLKIHLPRYSNGCCKTQRNLATNWSTYPSAPKHRRGVAWLPLQSSAPVAGRHPSSSAPAIGAEVKQV